jgi:hypothetical protein
MNIEQIKRLKQMVENNHIFHTKTGSFEVRYLRYGAERKVVPVKYKYKFYLN